MPIGEKRFWGGNAIKGLTVFVTSLIFCGCAANFAPGGQVTETIDAPVSVELPEGLPDPRVGAEPESCAERCAKCAAYGAACQETCELNCVRQHHPVCPDNCKP